MRKSALTAALLGSITTAAAAQPHGHGGDGVVGVDGSGKLAIEIDLDEAYIFEEIYSGFGLSGYIGDEPGFVSLDEDEPDEDFYTLGHDADLYFRLVGRSDPEIQVYNPFFDVPGLADGESFSLGAGDHIHAHPFWFLNTNLPSFDPAKGEWSVQFQIVDLGATGYADSDVYEIRFAIPAPATAVLLGLGAVASGRRRR